LRRFLAFSEAAAAEVGVPAQQHQAMLAIAGRVGAEPPSVGMLAEVLLIAPNTGAELVSRMLEGGLLVKKPSRRDRRRTELTLTRRGRQLRRSLTAAHLEELQSLKTALKRVLGQHRKQASAEAGGGEGSSAPRTRRR